jgi:transcriptional regulator with XRE-family HTH domain
MALLIDPVMLGKRIQEIRTGKKLTQAKLAKKAGCARKTIIGLESGDNTSTHTLFRVLSELGLALDLQPHTVDLNLLDSLVEAY